MRSLVLLFGVVASCVVAEPATEGDSPVSSASEGLVLRPILVIRVDYADAPGAPLSEAYARELVDDRLSAIYQEMSYGRVGFRATVTPVLRMSRTSADYLRQGGAMQEARDLAGVAGHNLRSYFAHVIFSRPFVGLVTNDIPSANGIHGIGISDPVGTYGAAVVLMAHEYGHTSTLGHSGYRGPTSTSPTGPAVAQSQEGHPWDLMGGGYFPHDHFSAAWKARLGWLTNDQYQRVTTSGVFRLYNLTLPTRSGLRALRVAASSTFDDWIEFRSGVRSAGELEPRSGLLVTRAPTFLDGDLFLLDMTPLSPAGKYDAMLRVGRTYSNVATGVHVTPTAMADNGEWIDVEVNIDAGAHEAPTLSLEASTVRAEIGQDVTLTAHTTGAARLAYGWDIQGDPKALPNAAVITTRFAEPGHYVVTCVVSDLRGSTRSRTVAIEVGAPSLGFLDGNIRDARGRPEEGVAVWALGPSTWRTPEGSPPAGRFPFAITDSAGYYRLANLPAGVWTASAVKLSRRVSALSSTSVTVAGSGRRIDWVTAPTYEISLPTGPVSRVTGQAGTYSATGVQDPALGDIWNFPSTAFDWGDGTTSIANPNGVLTAVKAHTWARAGFYAVRARIYDYLFRSSDWSAPLWIEVRTACVSDSACEDGERCAAPRCVARECTTKNDCGDRECISGFCRIPCVTNPDCSVVERCDRGACVAQ